MKLGTQTGSLTNHLYSRGVIGQPEPVVGMGVTLLSWTDRHAGTIVDILANGILVIQEDCATRIDKGGYYTESQQYAYTRNARGRVYQFRKAKNGMWQEVSYSQETKRWSKTNGAGLRIGAREEYRDPSF